MKTPANESGYAEKRLLVVCARKQLTTDQAASLRELASAPLDWDFVIASAAENSVMPLVARQLSAHAADLVPAEKLDRIKGAARANSLRCLALTAELLRVLGEFGKRGIEAIPYKGPALAAQAYDDVAMREYEDLDIVLRQRDLRAADEAMRSLGYTPRYPWIHEGRAAAALVPGEYNYREETRGIVVELHTEKTMRHFPSPIDLEALSLRLTIVSLGGHEVRTFSAEDGLGILCVHGAKDYWERIVWVADIAELGQRGSGCDWQLVFQRAEKMKAGRMLRLGLALAVELLEMPAPREVDERLEADSAATAIAHERATALLEREPRRMSASDIFRYRRRMVDGGFAGWRYAWRLALAPAEDDWKAANLPSWLAPLYPALRPFRLLKKHGWAGGSSRGGGAAR